MIEQEGVGLAVPGDDPSLLHAHALRLADDAELRRQMGGTGKALASRMFSQRSRS